MEETEFRKKYAGRERVKTMAEFETLLNEATQDANDYGSIVVCCSLMMNAAFSLVNNGPHGGITGFQAGCLMWEMVKQYGMFGEDARLRIVNWNDLMYPQLVYKFTTIPRETWDAVVAKAKLEVKDFKGHGDVFKHMQSVAEGILPPGFRIEE